MTRKWRKKLKIKDKNPDLKRERTLKKEGQTDTITRYQRRTNEREQKIEEAMEDKYKIEDK